MANKVTLTPFKRGETPTFRFAFTNPYVGFNWSGITLNGAITDITAPNDNTGAAATRLSQSLVTDGTTGAHYDFTLTIVESKALIPGATYNVEVELLQGGVSAAKPITASVKVLQDFVI